MPMKRITKILRGTVSKSSRIERIIESLELTKVNKTVVDIDAWPWYNGFINKGQLAQQETMTWNTLFVTFWLV